MSTHRWVCPECGAGVLAGRAPRTNATVRYCLPCSAKSDTLVERTCPVLDRKREEREERRRAKSKRQRDAAAAKRAEEKHSEHERIMAVNEAKKDRRGSGDSPENMEKSFQLLDRKLPASVYYHSSETGAFGLSLSDTAVRSLSAWHAPHSRASLNVLLDYAESIGHPDAATMRENFVRYGGMPGVKARSLSATG